jgi:hypothetical protein
MMILTVIAFAPLYRGQFRPIVLMGLIGVSGFVFQGSRGPIITTAAALAVMFAALGHSIRAIIGRLGWACIMAVGVIVLSLMYVAGGGVNEKIAPLLERQQKGLANPLDQHDSTFVDHVQMGVSGIVRGIYYPFGQGLGATTIAARYSDDDAAVGSTEIDITNMFASLGFAGGVLYTVIVAKVMLMSFRLIRYQRSIQSIAILGILVAEGGQWLTGSHYAVSSIVWFTIGSLVRQTEEIEGELAPAPI